MFLQFWGCNNLPDRCGVLSASIVCCILSVDSSLLRYSCRPSIAFTLERLTQLRRIIEGETDRTICLFSRTLVREPAPADVHVILTALSAVFHPDMYTHGRDPSYIVRALLEGVPNRSAHVLLRRITELLPRLQIPEWQNTVIFLQGLVKNVQQLSLGEQASVIAALCHSDVLSYLFSRARCIQNVDDDDGGRDIVRITQFVACFLERLRTANVVSVRLFVGACERANLFHFLQHVISVISPPVIINITYSE